MKPEVFNFYFKKLIEILDNDEYKELLGCQNLKSALNARKMELEMLSDDQFGEEIKKLSKQHLSFSYWSWVGLSSEQDAKFQRLLDHVKVQILDPVASKKDPFETENRQNLPKKVPQLPEGMREGSEGDDDEMKDFLFREQFDGLDLNEKPGEAVPSKPKRERKKPGTFTPHAINAAKTHSMKLRSDLEEDKASTSDESLEDESYGRGGAEIPHGAHRTPLGRPGQSY